MEAQRATHLLLTSAAHACEVILRGAGTATTFIGRILRWRNPPQSVESAQSRSLTANHERETGHAERTKRADSPGGRDRQCCAHCQDRNWRDRRYEPEATSKAQQRFSGREGTSGEHHGNPAQRDRAQGRTGEVGVMSVSPESAAYRLCEKAGWSLTQLSVQKGLYLAHMLHLGRTNGAPLLNEEFQA